MKTLLLIRHAKADWPEGKAPANATDRDRPLTERGEADAVRMAQRLQQLKAVPELLISSPALRAATTARIMAHEWNYPEDAIQWQPRLYQADLTDFIETITALPDTWKSIALVSHNPSITLFANALTAYNIQHIPTCGVVAFHVQTTEWARFWPAEKKLWFFEYPENLQQSRV
ncbi:MAG: histidine phosphatase family protein [Thermoflavifilum aggregans]|nr:histidine phosphatase family protein [Thermoflavifilum aggregans]